MSSVMEGVDRLTRIAGFLVGPIRCEVTVQQVRRDVEGVVAVCRRLEFACSFNDDPVLAQ